MRICMIMQMTNLGVAMDVRTRDKYETKARIIRALAHPVRLFLVEKLAEAPLCVGDLTGLTDLDMSTVSRHLRVLRTAGIVASEKRGNTVLCRLRVPCVLTWTECIEAVLRLDVKERLDALR